MRRHARIVEPFCAPVAHVFPLAACRPPSSDKIELQCSRAAGYLPSSQQELATPPGSGARPPAADMGFATPPEVTTFAEAELGPHGEGLERVPTDMRGAVQEALEELEPLGEEEEEGAVPMAMMPTPPSAAAPAAAAGPQPVSVRRRAPAAAVAAAPAPASAGAASGPMMRAARGPGKRRVPVTTASHVALPEAGPEVLSAALAPTLEEAIQAAGPAAMAEVAEEAQPVPVVHHHPAPVAVTRRTAAAAAAAAPAAPAVSSGDEDEFVGGVFGLAPEYEEPSEPEVPEAAVPHKLRTAEDARRRLAGLAGCYPRGSSALHAYCMV